MQLGLERPLVVIVSQHEGAVDRLEGLGEAPQVGLDLGGEPKDIGPEERGAHGAANGEPPLGFGEALHTPAHVAQEPPEHAARVGNPEVEALFTAQGHQPLCVPQRVTIPAEERHIRHPEQAKGRHERVGETFGDQSRLPHGRHCLIGFPHDPADESRIGQGRHGGVDAAEERVARIERGIVEGKRTRQVLARRRELGAHGGRSRPWRSARSSAHAGLPRPVRHEVSGAPL